MQKNWDNIAGGWSGGEERRCWRCCWSSIKKCTHSAACRTRCQKGKFGTDRCSWGGGWAHLLQPQRNRVNEFSFGQSNKEHCQPSDFSSSRMKFWRRGKRIYIRDPDLYRAAWFLALPYPMNRVLVLIYPKHQISPLL